MTEYISSPHHIRDLLEGVAWTDIKAEIVDMLENIKDNLITCKSRAEIYRYQGRAEALKAILMMPEIILTSLEEASEKNESNENELEV